jgi:hypothetical protein
MRHRSMPVAVLLLLGAGCGKSGSEPKVYAFTSPASTAIGRVALAPLAARVMAPAAAPTGASSPVAVTVGPTLCGSTVCFTPTALTGTYFGTGLLLQVGGKGMVAYFGQEAWSGITGTSPSAAFDVGAPITHAGTLSCCAGDGDLSTPDVYVSDVIYLFGTIDATFSVSGVTSNTSMNREFTVRFVMADGALPTAKRGDVLLKDPADGQFKWMDPSTTTGGDVGAGTLVTTRPASPVTMDGAVVNYVNPFSTTQGNQQIPVFYAPVTSLDGTPYAIDEAGLRLVGRTYTFRFDPTNFVMFPAVLTADLDQLYSYKQLLSKVHLGGLPHSQQPMGVGSPAATVLEVSAVPVTR